MTKRMAQDRTGYIPPFRYRLFTPLYDIFCILLGLGPRFRRKILAATPLSASDVILDVGCGTGTMTRMMKRLAPKATVIGIDADAAALAIAREKARKEGFETFYVQASAAKMPFPDSAFDLITCTLVFHHLPGGVKQVVLKEIRRLLKPKGHFVLTDFGKPKHSLLAPLPWLGAVVEEGKENYAGKLPKMIIEAGFTDVTVLARPRPDVDIITSSVPIAGSSRQTLVR